MHAGFEMEDFGPPFPNFVNFFKNLHPKNGIIQSVFSMNCDKIEHTYVLCPKHDKKTVQHFSS